MNQAVALQYIALLDWDGKYNQAKCNSVRFTHRYFMLVCGFLMLLITEILRCVIFELSWTRCAETCFLFEHFCAVNLNIDLNQLGMFLVNNQVT